MRFHAIIAVPGSLVVSAVAVEASMPHFITARK
jgi:hypothetical protein